MGRRVRGEQAGDPPCGWLSPRGAGAGTRWPSRVARSTSPRSSRQPAPGACGLRNRERARKTYWGTRLQLGLLSEWLGVPARVTPVPSRGTCNCPQELQPPSRPPDHCKWKTPVDTRWRLQGALRSGGACCCGGGSPLAPRGRKLGWWGGDPGGRLAPGGPRRECTLLSPGTGERRSGERPLGMGSPPGRGLGAAGSLPPTTSGPGRPLTWPGWSCPSPGGRAGGRGACGSCAGDGGSLSGAAGPGAVVAAAAAAAARSVSRRIPANSAPPWARGSLARVRVWAPALVFVALRPCDGCGGGARGQPLLPRPDAREGASPPAQQRPGGPASGVHPGPIPGPQCLHPALH